MKFKVEKRQRITNYQYPKKEFDIARKFAKLVYKEFGDFIKAVILFGSVTQDKKKKNDIDILIILDDVRVKLTQEIVQTYRIIVEKIIANVDRKLLHVQSMKFTSFWEYVRAGDPVAINILRYGLSLIDTGFFDPLQALLDQGRIRPSKESIYTYFVLAPASLSRAKEHLLSASIDLYWSVIDASHAALMKYGEIPPTPDHVADLLEKTLIKDKILTKKAAMTVRTFYKIFKSVVNREIKEVSGKDYDNWKRMAEDYVSEIKKYLEK